VCSQRHFLFIRQFHHFYHQFLFSFDIFHVAIIVPFNTLTHKKADEKVDRSFGFGKFLNAKINCFFNYWKTYYHFNVVDEVQSISGTIKHIISGKDHHPGLSILPWRAEPQF
jgi:hypothetical protein